LRQFHLNIVEREAFQGMLLKDEGR